MSDPILRHGVSDGTPASWTGAPPSTPTAGGCGGPSNPACDNFQLTIVPPSYAYNVEITLTPQLADDYDLEVYGPDGQLVGTSGNLNGQVEQAVLQNPAAGTYTVTAVPYAAAFPYTAGARIVQQPPPAASTWRAACWWPMPTVASAAA